MHASQAAAKTLSCVRTRQAIGLFHQHGLFGGAWAATEMENPLAIARFVPVHFESTAFLPRSKTAGFKARISEWNIFTGHNGLHRSGQQT